MVRNTEFKKIAEAEFLAFKEGSVPLPEEAYSAILGIISLQSRKRGEEITLNGRNVKIFKCKEDSYLIKHWSTDKTMIYYKLDILKDPALDISINI